MKNATVVLSVLFQLIFNRERMITALLQALYYNRRNFCNLIGSEQWYFSLI